jgi:hypothetical protein
MKIEGDELAGLVCANARTACAALLSPDQRLEAYDAIMGLIWHSFVGTAEATP